MTEFDLSECNCFAARKAARRLTQIYDARLASCGIKSTQLVILATINRKGELSVNDLAQAISLDRTTTGKNLKPMERDGYLKSIVSNSDRRGRKIFLTAKGEGVLARAFPFWKAANDEFEREHGKSFATEYRRILRETASWREKELSETIQAGPEAQHAEVKHPRPVGREVPRRRKKS
jgi:DNA-binding MarR family transcriptional regulator